MDKLLLLGATMAEAIETATQSHGQEQVNNQRILANNATASRDPDFKNISVQ